MENATKSANETRTVKVTEPKQIVEADGFVIAKYTYEIGKEESRVTFSFDFNEDYRLGGILSKRSNGSKGTLEIIIGKENVMFFNTENARNLDDWWSMGTSIDSRLNEDVLKLRTASRASEENVAARLLGKAAACLKETIEHKKLTAQRERAISKLDDIKNAIDHRHNAFALARRIDDGLQGIKHEKDAY